MLTSFTACLSACLSVWLKTDCLSLSFTFRSYCSHWWRSWGLSSPASCLPLFYILCFTSFSPILCPTSFLTSSVLHLVLYPLSCTLCPTSCPTSSVLLHCVFSILSHLPFSYNMYNIKCNIIDIIISRLPSCVIIIILCYFSLWSACNVCLCEVCLS